LNGSGLVRTSSTAICSLDYETVSNKMTEVEQEYFACVMKQRLIFIRFEFQPFVFKSFDNSFCNRYLINF
jgi:hypothetical protein